ncbi:putative DNA-binding domain-containing protein [Photobacterium sp. TY1-4]|uniref:HvfC/BufC family peptide modification chaperone n=1 Tax=Photobacterium sp. TY1-4 TaxID=2899122 RepID=UPI0021C226B2|nr:putative DNA-binding domain-containing protein [Photobacterium sp. TY1-4]UXI03265.1 putative DNA-binding domain-containing protein [Photobacterium sp. TY1-4]
MAHPTLQQSQQWLMTILAVRGDLRQKVMAATQATHLPPESYLADPNEGNRRLEPPGHTQPQEPTAGDTSISIAEAQARSLASPLRRLDIYAAGYVMRLVECLQAEYRILAAFMGEKVFHDFAKAYIVSRPSSHRSLYDLGRDFPRFLAETRPDGDLNPEQRAFFVLPQEIAQVERARAEVALAKGFEGKPLSVSPMLNGLALFHEPIRLTPAPCLRLLALEYPVLPLMSALEAAQEAARANTANSTDGLSPQTGAPELTSAALTIPESAANWLALSRVNYQLTTVELTPWQHALLTACQQSAGLNEAVHAAAQSEGLNTGDIYTRLMLWLPAAVTQGLLCVDGETLP